MTEVDIWLQGFTQVTRCHSLSQVVTRSQDEAKGDHVTDCHDSSDHVIDRDVKVCHALSSVVSVGLFGYRFAAIVVSILRVQNREPVESRITNFAAGSPRNRFATVPKPV